MNFELDTLIALAFVVPVVFFAVLNLVTLRTGGFRMDARPVQQQVGEAAPAVDVNVAAANDGEFREAA